MGIDAFPDLSSSTQTVVRIGYGLLLLLTIVQALPESRRFFLSERWGGYAASSPDVDAFQNPVVLPALMAIWFAAAACLTVGWWTVAAAAVNVVLCRYFFVHMRWKGVLRGMGAPGFYTYWLGLAVCLLEYTSQYAVALRPFALLVVQADVAFIMLSAGIYKFAAGYPRNEGMEVGMANPMWGYWWRFYVGMATAGGILGAMATENFIKPDRARGRSEAERRNGASTRRVGTVDVSFSRHGAIMAGSGIKGHHPLISLTF